MAAICPGSANPFSTMLQPACANRSAAARPRPCVEPVMSAVLPARIRSAGRRVAARSTKPGHYVITEPPDLLRSCSEPVSDHV